MLTSLINTSAVLMVRVRQIIVNKGTEMTAEKKVQKIGMFSRSNIVFVYSIVTY